VLKSIRIKNFQSIHDAEIALGKFTVLVGPSNSGKSAVLRAFRTIISNASGSAFVTHGKTKSELELHTDEGWAIFLERGKSLSTYRVITDHGDEEVYSKSGTKVPDDIAKLLCVPEVEGERLQFAFQFDRPYLMDAPGSKIASVIGDLTNINILHEAVREANRRRLEAKSKLKVRTGDLEVESAKLQSYADLPTLRDALSHAREVYDQAFRLFTLRAALLGFVEVAEAAESDVQRLRSRELPRVSIDVLGLQERSRKLDVLRALVGTIEREARVRQEAQKFLQESEARIEECRDRHHTMLKEAGTCPTCGQTTVSI
jgi:exonuclease SbcC